MFELLLEGLEQQHASASISFLNSEENVKMAAATLCEEETSLASQCLAFCQALASQGKAFKFSLAINSAFSFSLSMLRCLSTFLLSTASIPDTGDSKCLSELWKCLFSFFRSPHHFVHLHLRQMRGIFIKHLNYVHALKNCFPQLHNSFHFFVFLSSCTQCPRTDLNKRFLPRPKTTTA